MQFVFYTYNYMVYLIDTTNIIIQALVLSPLTVVSLDTIWQYKKNGHWSYDLSNLVNEMVTGYMTQ